MRKWENWKMGKWRK